MTTYLQPTATTLLDRATALSRARVPFVLATVVRAQRPATSRAGDIALLHADGWIDGFVGGGSIEHALREHGQQVLAGNEPLLLRIVSTDPLVPAEPGTVTVVDPLLAGGALEVFLEARLPAPRVLVVGETPLVRAMSTLGTMLGFAVEQVDSWGATTSEQPSAHDAAFVVASAGQGETRLIESALRTGVPYIGLVAGAARSAEVLAALEATDQERERVHAPAGLDIGATTAPEIALSLFAHIVAGIKQVPATSHAPAAVAAPATAHAPVADHAPATAEPVPADVSAEDGEPAAVAVAEEVAGPERGAHHQDGDDGASPVGDARQRHARPVEEEGNSLYGWDRSARPPLSSVRERADDLVASLRERGHHQAAPVRSDEPLTISFDRGDAPARERRRPSVARVADPAVG